jgi:hypothetical protein
VRGPTDGRPIRSVSVYIWLERDTRDVKVDENACLLPLCQTNATRRGDSSKNRGGFLTWAFGANPGESGPGVGLLNAVAFLPTLFASLRARGLSISPGLR